LDRFSGMGASKSDGNRVAQGPEARETPHPLQKHRDALKPSVGGNGRRNGPMLLPSTV